MTRNHLEYAAIAAVPASEPPPKLFVHLGHIPEEKLRPPRWSTTIPAQAFEIAPSFTPEEWMIYCMLLHRADKQGHCFPSVPRLCRDSGMTRYAVLKAIVGLERHKIIEVDRRDGEVSNYYVLLRNQRRK